METVKFNVPQNSEVKVKQEEADGKQLIVIEIAPKWEPKDGDIISVDFPVDGKMYSLISILKGDIENCHRDYILYKYAGLSGMGKLETSTSGFGLNLCDKVRPATEEEKQQLFDALKKDGKRWNAEKKCIEDLPEELKVGDWVIFKGRGYYNDTLLGTLTAIDNTDQERPYLVSNSYCAREVLKWDGTKEQLEKVRRGEITV